MLPLRPRPEADETLVGYMVRLAGVNGREDVLAFSRSLGMPFAVLRAAGTRRFDPGILAAASGVPPARLAAMAAWPSARGRLAFNGRDLSRPMISLSRRRACPGCLAASAHHRAAWDLTLAGACPEHRARLIDACPSCRAPLGWTHPSIATCACGFDLTRAPSDPVPERESGGIGEIHRLLGIAFTPGPERHRAVSPAVEEIGADGTITLMWQLGWFEDGGRGLPRPLREARRRPDLHLLLDAGLRAASDWPASFHAFLDRQRERSGSRPGRFGARKELGPVAEWAASLAADGPVGRLVLSGLDSYRPCASPLASRSPIMAAVARRGATLTLGRAAEMLGGSRSKARAALARRGIAASGDGLGRGASILIMRADAEATADARDDLLDRRTLARELGCGRKVLDALLAAGVLLPAEAAAGFDGLRRWRSSEAAALVRGLEARAIPRPGRAVTFPAALRSLRQGGLAPAEAVRRILRGGPAPVGTDLDAIGLARVLLPADEVAALAREVRPDPETLSIPEFAAALGLKQEIAYRLCGSGVIRSGPGDGTRRGLRVPRSETDRFRLEFVLPGTLVPGAGRHRGWLADLLIAAGVAPVSGPGADGGRHWVFRRAEVEVWLRDHPDLTRRDARARR